MKKKYMDRRNWKRVTQRRYAEIFMNEDNIQGKVSLLHIEKVSEPAYKEYCGDKKVKIADDNFYWLQLGIADANYWITVMYDHNKELIQYYIDITERNVLNGEDGAGFYDLFLDIVLLKDGSLFLLDENELGQAMKDGNITQGQYDLACRTADQIMGNLPQKAEELGNICDQYFRILCNKL